MALFGLHVGRFVQVLDTGQIVWCKSIVRARGVAAPATAHGDGDTGVDSPPDTLQAARRIAEANLLETVGTIRIDSRLRVVDRMAQDNAFRTGLTTLIQNASLTHQEYLSDGTVEVELEMSITGGFAPVRAARGDSTGGFGHDRHQHQTGRSSAGHTHEDG